MKAIKSRFRGWRGGVVLGETVGNQIREGVRRNRLQKWEAASLNTGFSSIFDFGDPSKDGGISFTKVHIN
jgi:hypothetical protein